MPKRKAKIIGLQDPSVHQKTTTELQKQQRGISGRLRSVLSNKQNTAALDEETRLLIKRARLEALEADNYIESAYTNFSLSATPSSTTIGPSIEDEDFYVGEPETSKKITAIRPKLSNLGYHASSSATTASTAPSATTGTGGAGGRKGRGTATIPPPSVPTTTTIPTVSSTSLPATTLSTSASITPSISTIIPKGNIKLRKYPDLVLYESSPLLLEKHSRTTKYSSGTMIVPSSFSLNTVLLSNGMPLSSLPLYQGPTLLAEHSQVASVGNSSLPNRPFCMVCGFEGKYTCTKCGTRFCSTTCGNHHQETRCIVKPLR